MHAHASEHCPMRRKDRQLTQEQTLAILHKAEFGSMATTNSDGSPYATFLSYVLMNGKIYFHCAQEGQKIENITRDPRVCFTVANNVHAAFDTDFTTSYESAVIFGKASLVTDDTEKREALFALAQKYLPEHCDKAEASINKSIKRTAVYSISLEHSSGKAKVLKGPKAE